MDVKSAFLYGTIEEEVYVTQLSVFKDPDNLDKVYKVVKALYGLHQAPRAWYETLANYLLGNGFKRGKIDQTLFIKKQKGDILLVQVYVDDIIFGSTNKELCTGFEKLMKDKFHMSSMGELTFFLGLQVQQKEDGIFIIDLEKPLVKDGDANNVDVHLYRSMIGSLMYLTTSRPDIMFAVCACARFQVTPKTSHLLAVKRIFRYLKGKPTLGLWYSRDSPFKLVDILAVQEANCGDTSTTEAGICADASCCGTSTLDKQAASQKEVGTLRYLSLVVPLKKVGDEAVHKELGDRMERAATTASSLEAEQESGSGPRCQDTILGGVDAQTSGEDSMKLLELMANCTKTVCMLKLTLIAVKITVASYFTTVMASGIAASSSYMPAEGAIYRYLEFGIRYALTVNPTIYTSCIEQFWATARAKTVNGERQIQALIDKKKVILMETSIRSDLHLEDAGGIDCLPTATIFEELARMGAKSTAWNEFSSTMASLIICLATNQNFNLSKYIFDAMLGDMSHHKKIFVNLSHTKKIFANMKREGKDFSRRITPLFETMMVQPTQDEGVNSRIPVDSLQIPITTQPSSFRSQKKQSRRKQRKDAAITQEELQQGDSVPTPSNDPPLSEKAKDAQAKEIADLKKRVQRLEKKKKSRAIGLKRLKKVGMSRRVESSEDQESLGEVNYHTCFDINDLHGDEVNVDMPVGDNQEQSVKEREVDTSVEGSVAPTTIEEITLAQTLIQIKAAKPKVVPLEKEKMKLLLVKIGKKSSELQLEIITSNEGGGYKHNQLKSKSYEEIQKLFDNEMRRVNTFIPMDSEVVKSKKGTEESSKGTEDELESNKSKKAESSEEKAKSSRKKMLETDEHEEVEVDDEAELKKHLVIVKDDEIAIDVIPLATKPPVIVEYKLLKEGIMVHYQLIRADGSSKRYSSMIRMLQDIDREDLETLWKLVKTKHGDTRHEDEHERVL
ncbi:putative ribonuclease H-like domain-containing protein [Tanacetum coccineum]